MLNRFVDRLLAATPNMELENQLNNLIAAGTNGVEVLANKVVLYDAENDSEILEVLKNGKVQAFVRDLSFSDLVDAMREDLEDALVGRKSSINTKNLDKAIKANSKSLEGYLRDLNKIYAELKQVKWFN